jgi:isopropylmalate/homocitrate/citramalate synthase
VEAPDGETLFVRESGAVASQFHDPPAIEPYSAELVRAERGIVLGKKSGLDSIRIKLAQLGIERPQEDWPALLAAVKELGGRERRLVSDAEFRAIAARARACRLSARRSARSAPPDTTASGGRFDT